MSNRWSRRFIFTLCTSLITLGAAVGFASLASAASTGQVYIVQAIAGATVEVTVDGSVVQASAAPKAVIGPLSLKAGQHVIQVSAGSSRLVSARFTVTGKDSLDVVAHRAADKATSPVVTVFKNDLAAVGPGKSRLVVSHVAVAEPADIRVDGKPYFRNVANGESLSLVVPARSYSLDVVATVGGRTILGPVSAALQAGTLTRVFAFGNPDDKTTDAIVQVIKVSVVGAGTPTSVHTGDGGQAADQIVSQSRVPWSVWAGVVGLLGAAMIAGAARGSARSLQATGVRR
jgi:hypothetical protein